VFERLRKGVRGGMGGRSSLRGGSGAVAPEFFFSHITGRHISRTTFYLGGFSAHGFLPMVFYFRLRN
jgi:hypothetical protein